jgi:cytochrome P450
MFKSISWFKWQGTEHTYKLPWLKNRIEYSADPDRVKEYLSSCPFTRSRLNINILKAFHLSTHSLVVSNDDHAHLLRKRFYQHMPGQREFPRIAKELSDNLFRPNLEKGSFKKMNLTDDLIREVYKSLLVNMLGVKLHHPIEDYLQSVVFKPSTKPMKISGLLVSLGVRGSAFSPVRKLIELTFFRGDHYMRKVAINLEELVINHSTPLEGSWFSALQALKENGKLSNAQFRGEISSMLVSAFTLSSIISSLVLCIAARPQYKVKINRDKDFANFFVNEVLRLYPPFRQFGYERKNTKDISQTKKGETTDFMVFTFGLQRNSKSWNNPHKFYPERFVNRKARNGCDFIPFGIGPRSCTGRSYSLKLLVALTQYLCSEKSGVELLLPEDYVANSEGMPIGINGRLISFPSDDRVNVMARVNMI